MDVCNDMNCYEDSSLLIKNKKSKQEYLNSFCTNTTTHTINFTIYINTTTTTTSFTTTPSTAKTLMRT